MSGCSAALAAWSLLVFGCHGWMPVALQPFVLGVLGAALLAAAGPARFGAWSRPLRYGPLLLGVAARQSLGSDLLAILGLHSSMQLVASNAASQRVERSLVGLAILQVQLSTTLGFYLEASIQAAISGLVSWSGTPAELDPVYGGARSALVVALLIATFHTGSAWARIWRVGSAFALAVLGAILVAQLAGLLAPFGSSTTNNPALAVVATQLPWAPFVLGLGGAVWLTRSPGDAAAAAAGGRGPTLVLAVVAAVMVLVSLPPAGLRAAQKVVFYRPGFSNWETADPNLSGAGPYSTGMMGSLPMFARALGQQAQLVDALDAAALADADVLVLVNQDHSLGKASLELVAGWIRGGGHLIVVGDHTFFGQAEGRFEMFVNEPLALTSIRFANNSADHLTHAFRDATVTVGLGGILDCVAGNPYSPIIGAGLEVGWPARPIVIGRHGFLDEGRMPTPANDDAIGDLTWNVGERLGGVVLLAEQQVGAGRVTAVGDTTGFHNIARSSAWPAAARLLRSDPLQSRWHYWLTALVLLGMAGSQSPLVRRRLPSAWEGTLWLALLSAPFLPIADRTNNPLVGSDVPLVILDTAVYPAGKLGDWTDDGYLTLISGAMRSGALPLFTSTAEHGIPPATRALLVSSPRVDPGPVWRRAVVDWVERGGHLIVAADFGAQPLLSGLLTQFGCRIGPLVMGPQSVEVGLDGGALVIRLEESWNLEFESGDWSRIVYRGDTTSMARRPWGKGLVTIITDRQFLMNRNQENRDIIRLPNLKFLMRLLGTTGSSR
ncbi:MAG: hypothetical protein JNK49_13680 [Planctomycetes bacterium]|nr:hypothetical protein [Planctomycetota bacterium]